MPSRRTTGTQRSVARRDLQVAAISAFALPARKGAEPIIQLAVGAEASTGYYDRLSKVRSSPISYDEELARRVWATTENLTGVRIMDNAQ